VASWWSAWRQASLALEQATTRQGQLARERDRLLWQIAEVDKLAPGADEWDELEGEHRRLANAQSLMDGARAAVDALSESDENAQALLGRALRALEDVAAFDSSLNATIEELLSAQAQLEDAAHTLSSYLNRADMEPARLQSLDARISAWLALARRHRCPAAELPAVVQGWRDELRALDAQTDLQGLQAAVTQALAAFEREARRVSAARRTAAPKLSAAITQAMQHLGMAGGCFEVALLAQDEPQSYGLESAEFLVAGHAGSTPRALAKVASGGELSRIALAIAVTTSQRSHAAASGAALIFDEIDAGIGGAVAETVGRLMKQLGAERQVLAVTHLPQVAACADHHYVVTKRVHDGLTASHVQEVQGEVRVAEIARMLGGERLSGTSLAHAQEMLAVGAERVPAARGRKRP
jgi:DNA repair protein RecN (Recombination protein N)